MKLVIVESPTKARTIGKFLGKDYEIKASMGHLMDLPKSTLGVDVEHNFVPDFELMSDKKKIISELKTAAKSAEEIILATDPDREGEAIASHVKELLQDKKNGDKFKRIVFHEITKEAIDEAFTHSRSIDENLVNAQTARRVLDRLVGYKLSPLLWQKVRRGLSAGRVQSVALRLIVEREREIEKFKKEPYWTIFVILNSFQDLEMLKQVQHDKKEGTEFELIEMNGQKIEQQEKFKLYNGDYTTTKTTISSEESAKQIVADLQSKQFIVSDVTQKETKRTPAPPYTTSTLQQDGVRRLGFSGKRTMSLAQKLYEEGYITYHRTDSVTMSASAQGAIIGFVKKEFGEKYVQPRNYKTKQKLAQEAHEAIRPTNVGESPTQNSPPAGGLKTQIGNDYFRLYEMIWRRAVASQMSDAVIESTSILVHVIPNSFRDLNSDSKEMLKQVQHDKKTEYTLKTNGSVLVFEGFLKVNPQALQDTRLPEFFAKQNLDLIKAEDQAHETAPPPRYNEASLIKSLEEEGIGRPSTYATIISTIEGRNYIERQEGKFVPTSVGEAVNDFLVTHFSDIDDIPFTAQMEDQLDEIAHGQKEWAPILKEFYAPFSQKLESAQSAERVHIKTEATSQICEKCGSPVVIRIGRFGKFFSCSRFPECDFKKAYVEETSFLCPKDNGKIIIRKTKRGRKFYGCSNYPACDYASWTRPTSPASDSSALNVQKENN